MGEPTKLLRLDGDFQTKVKEASTTADWENLVGFYGTHAIAKIHTGGRLIIETKQNTCKSSDAIRTEASASGNYGSWSGSAEIQVDTSKRKETGIESMRVIQMGGSTSASFN